MTPPTLLLSEDTARTVSTGAAQDDSFAHDAYERAAVVDAWQKVIDSKLIEWGRDPEAIAEDDLIPPSRFAVHNAIDLAKQLSQQGWAPPMRAVPDGDGGIVFERWAGVTAGAFEIDKYGRIELVMTRNGRVEERVELKVE